MSNKKKSPLELHLSSLKHGVTKQIQETIPASSFDLGDDLVQFVDDVQIEGEAYITDDWLILRLRVSAMAETLCGFCNEPFSFPCIVENASYEVALEEMKSGIVDCAEFVREALLLEVPFFPLCGKTVCTRRKSIEPYLGKEAHKPETYRPFEDIEKLFD